MRRNEIKAESLRALCKELGLVIEEDEDSFYAHFSDTKLENELLEDFRQQFNNNGGYFTIKGICLKENIDYQWDKSIHSYRAFYYKGKLLTIITTGDNLFDIVPQDFANKMPILNSNLYSIDFVKTKDDKIYVIDTNDAQISSIHNKEDLNEFYKNLYLYK